MTHRWAVPYWLQSYSIKPNCIQSYPIVRYAGEKDPMPLFAAFCEGFAEGGGLYTEEEIEARWLIGCDW